MDFTTAEITTAVRRRHRPPINAVALWLLTALFCLRVLGQALVELWQVSFLPPSEHWDSGLIPYGLLLACQILIIGLLAEICLDFSRQSGATYAPRRVAGPALLTFGALYLTAMIARYAIRMTIYPDQRWTGGLIPIFFHWILAACVLIVAVHHWGRRRTAHCEPEHSAGG